MQKRSKGQSWPEAKDLSSSSQIMNLVERDRVAWIGKITNRVGVNGRFFTYRSVIERLRRHNRLEDLGGPVL
jgi:hypothetical protein